jgi:hypothetical protein
MLLPKLISQTPMHAIFRFVSQDPRDRKYLERLDVVDREKIAPVPGRVRYVLDICFHRATSWELRSLQRGAIAGAPLGNDCPAALDMPRRPYGLS